MIARRWLIALALTACPQGGMARAQTSSLGAQKRAADVGKPAEKPLREAPPRPRNLVYERFGWFSPTPPPPKKFRPGDLVTIIVREQRQWEADSDLQTKSKFNAKSQLNAFVDATQGGIGASTFTRGKPNIDYKWDQQMKNEGDSKREDKFTTRITGTILDVKPNGLLVIEGRAKMTHDEEISEITLTGTCRKEDITADNTVLSTQIANKEVVVNNSGALRSSASRGWISKLLDVLKPF